MPVCVTHRAILARRTGGRIDESDFECPDPQRRRTAEHLSSTGAISVIDDAPTVTGGQG
jgi:hypothetical protein